MSFPFILLLVTIINLVNCDDRARADGAATALMKYYNQNSGLWDTAGWWNSANALTSIIDYMILSGSKQYLTMVQNTLLKAGSHRFVNEYVDDCGWWGLAWVRAYDLTRDQKYLRAAEYISDYMHSYSDTVCKGGLYWKTDRKNKNAIPNELFIKLAASLHNRIGGDSKYLNQAKEVWNWFKGTGMINGEHLINDGLVSLQTCKPGGETYTYNQGVILGGLVELFKATNDHAYLNDAQAIADGATKSAHLNPNGILREPGESDGCLGDGPSFKGIFVRNLGELSRVLSNNPYHGYLEKQADSAYNHDRNADNQYGDHWAGPLKPTGAACQHSALDLMNSVLK